MRSISMFLAGLGAAGCTTLLSAQMSEMSEMSELSPQDEQFFESNVRPILVEHCYSCHATDAERIRGGLVLDSKEGWEVGGISGPAIVPGDPDDSLLIEAVRWSDEDFQMPPNRKLSDREIAILEDWVRRGAPDPRVIKAISMVDLAEYVVPGGGVPKEAGADHWAFQPITRSVPPDVEDERWGTNEIDAFILAALESNNLQPTREASDETLIRRLSFDLRGFQPSPEEIEAFANNRSPEKWDEVVWTFLSSDAFGERWGRHWLDVARFAESSGKENDVPYPFAWRYRDWVIDAVNDDKPYDEFIRDQIAGDLLPVRSTQAAADRLVATAYLAIGPKSHRERNRAQFIADVADEQIDSITQGMLGLTVSCARCHDHKFDPISQEDYYQLAGVFISSQTLFGDSNQNNSMRSELYSLPVRGSDGTTTPLGLPMPELVRGFLERQQDRTESQIAQLEERVRTEDRESGARQQLRNAINRLEPLVATLERYDENGAPGISNCVTMGMRDAATPRDANLLVRGELDQRGPLVPRGVPPIANLTEPILVERGSGRLDFANWIASSDNPLTARVMANRVWLHLFGSGIVASTENFGLEGSPPSHPELLDHLASRFIGHGWSLKELVREIVSSSAYRMGSRENPRAVAVDPENTLLWRMSPKRLEGEAIRDAVLTSAGTLNTDPPSGSPVAWHAAQVRVGGTGTQLSDELSSIRSVYLPMTRSAVPDFLEAFDAAEPSFVIGDRNETNVPSQALFMLNDEWVTNQADAMAKRLLATRGTDNERVEEAFLLTFGRVPTASERGSVRTFFRDFARLDGQENAYMKDELAQRFDRAARAGGRVRDRANSARRRLAERGVSTDGIVDARTAAWSAFCQSLFATAEFRYVQ